MMRQHLTRQRRAAAGFTMIEVLVSLTIACFGLLGVAGLFLKGIEASSNSLIRTTAVQQVYDMADRMRANPSGLKSGAYNNVTANGQTTCICSAGSCDPTKLAAYDACLWNKQNATLLPSGSGTVTHTSGSLLYTIKVQWDDSKSGTATKSFSVQVDP